jgi:hypothetical protein
MHDRHVAILQRRDAFVFSEICRSLITIVILCTGTGYPGVCLRSCTYLEQAVAGSAKLRIIRMIRNMYSFHQLEA